MLAAADRALQVRTGGLVAAGHLHDHVDLGVVEERRGIRRQDAGGDLDAPRAVDVADQGTFQQQLDAGAAPERVTAMEEPVGDLRTDRSHADQSDVERSVVHLVAIVLAMALLLREADVERLGDLDSVMDAVEAAMTDLGKGEAQNQPRRRVFPPGGVLNVMFASWPGGGVCGLKSYTAGGGKARFLVVLYDLEGTPIALIEADRMGALRTGAATGVAARRLAPPGPKTVAVIGAGWQARTQVAALQRGLDIAELRVFSRTSESRHRFAAEVGGVAA